MTFTLRGECHCGNVAVTLDTAVDPGALPLRACQCSFCRRHGARVTTDPAGLLKISVRDPAILLRYRFGLGITDFLVCGRCGVFVSGVMSTDVGSLATLNVNVLDDGTPFQREATRVSYEDESREVRETRRRGAWTPVAWRPAPATMP
jgi:hypothetical protein